MMLPAGPMSQLGTPLFGSGLGPGSEPHFRATPDSAAQCCRLRLPWIGACACSSQLRALMVEPNASRDDDDDEPDMSKQVFSSSLIAFSVSSSSSGPKLWQFKFELVVAHQLSSSQLVDASPQNIYRLARSPKTERKGAGPGASRLRFLKLIARVWSFNHA